MYKILATFSGLCDECIDKLAIKICLRANRLMVIEQTSKTLFQGLRQARRGEAMPSSLRGRNGRHRFSLWPMPRRSRPQCLSLGRQREPRRGAEIRLGRRRHGTAGHGTRRGAGGASRTPASPHLRFRQLDYSPSCSAGPWQRTGDATRRDAPSPRGLSRLPAGSPNPPTPNPPSALRAFGPTQRPSGPQRLSQAHRGLTPLGRQQRLASLEASHRSVATPPGPGPPFFGHCRPIVVLFRHLLWRHEPIRAPYLTSWM